MIRHYTMPFQTRGYAETIRVPQYDKGYMIVFEMIDLPDGTEALDSYTAVVEGTRSDGLKYNYNCVISGASVSFEIDTRCTAVEGRGEARVRFLLNGEEYAAKKFIVEIEKSPVPDGAVDADTQAAQSAAELCRQIVDNAVNEIEQEVSVVFRDPNNDGNIVITTGAS